MISPSAPKMPQAYLVEDESPIAHAVIIEPSEVYVQASSTSFQSSPNTLPPSFPYVYDTSVAIYPSETIYNYNETTSMVVSENYQSFTRSLNLPFQVTNERGEVVRLNLPFNAVMIRESTCPLGSYQFTVPPALERSGVTLHEWKEYTRPLIKITKLRESNKRHHIDRWNRALIEWQGELNRNYFVPRGMFIKVISHQEGPCDPMHDLQGGKYWIVIALTFQESEKLRKEPSMTGTDAIDLELKGYCCHPDFGEEILPLKLRNWFWRVIQRRRLRRESLRRRHEWNR